MKIHRRFSETPVEEILTTSWWSSSAVQSYSCLRVLSEDCAALSRLIEVRQSSTDLPSGFRDDCIYLNPFATLYRYPEGDLMPDRDDVDKALESASRIFKFVSDKIE